MSINEFGYYHDGTIDEFGYSIFGSIDEFGRFAFPYGILEVTEILSVYDIHKTRPSKYYLESLAINESMNRVPLSLHSETLNIYEVIRSLISRTIEDTFHVIDTLFKFGHRNSIPETVTLSDYLNIPITFLLEELISVGDSVKKQITVTYGEVFEIVDKLKKNSSRYVEEMSLILDSISKQRKYILEEILNLADFIEKHSVYIISDAFRLIDTLLKTTHLVEYFKYGIGRAPQAIRYVSQEIRNKFTSYGVNDKFKSKIKFLRRS
ncbi:MAG: hypothetical protein ACTSPB_03625 [Candidatus Thorarchaeota archaeon]